MESVRFQGVVAATITPLDAHLEPDVARLTAHCRRLLEIGCDGINLLGTTGEAASLSVAQRIAVMRAVAESGLPLDRFIVGTGAAALGDAVALTREASALGYHGALVMPPFYYKNLDDAGLFSYFEELIARLEPGAARLFLYHFPAMSGVAFDETLVRRLIERFGAAILGIKDSSSDATFSRRIARACPELAVFPSSETTLAVAAADGFAGCISATANVTAPLAARVWRARRDPSDADAAALASVRTALTSAPLVAAIKSVVANFTRDPAYARIHPPLSPLAPVASAELERRLEELGAPFAELRAAYALRVAS